MNEAQTQKILKGWFEGRGFETIENIKINSNNNVDLVAKKEKEKWIIEVKGDYDRNSAQYNVNFDTGMGQILKSINTLNEKTNYAICIPFSRTKLGEKLSYRLILKKYSKSIIFEKLNIHIILVKDDETVDVINPKDIKAFLSSIDTKIRVW